MLLGYVVDQLLDQDGFANTGAAEQADLAALHVRGEEVDDLDAGFEDLLIRRQIGRFRRRTMDRPAFDISRQRVAAIDRLAEQVEDPAEGYVTHRDGDRSTGVDHEVAAAQTVGGIHGHGTDPVVTEMLLDLADQVLALTRVARFNPDLHCRVDLGQLVGEDHVDHDALNFFDSSGVVTVVL